MSDKLADESHWTMPEPRMVSVDDEIAERIAHGMGYRPPVDLPRLTVLAEQWAEAFSKLNAAIMASPEWSLFVRNLDASQRKAGRHKLGRGRRAPANRARRKAAIVIHGL